MSVKARRSMNHSPKGYRPFEGSQEEWNALDASAQVANKASRLIGQAPVTGSGDASMPGAVLPPAKPKKKAVVNVPRTLMNLQHKVIELAERLKRRGIDITLVMSGQFSEYTGGQIGKGSKKSTAWDKVITTGTSDEVAQKLTAAASRLADAHGGVTLISSAAASISDEKAFKKNRTKAKATSDDEVQASGEAALNGRQEEDLVVL